MGERERASNNEALKTEATSHSLAYRQVFLILMLDTNRITCYNATY